jgi:polyhydroxyalkanoate synthase
VNVDLGKIKLPTYVFAAKEDHIAPWPTCYSSARLLTGNTRFVLGASGHIAGTINPVSSNKRHYWTNPTLADTADDWLAQATQQPGSWWQDWDSWLSPQSGKQVPAPAQPGSAEHPPLEAAPGRYVREKAVKV